MLLDAGAMPLGEPATEIAARRRVGRSAVPSSSATAAPVHELAGRRPHGEHGAACQLSRTAHAGVRGYRRLLSYAAPYRRGWAAIVAVTLLSTGLSLLQPWPIKVLVDHVLGEAPLRGSARRVGRGCRRTDHARGLLAWVVARRRRDLRREQRRRGRRADDAVDPRRAANGLPARAATCSRACSGDSLRAHATHSVGDSMGRVAVDAWCVHAVVDTLLFAPGHALFTTVVMVVVMLRLDAGLTLLALAVAPFMTAAAWLFGRPIREAAHARREIESRIQSHVHQTLTGVSVVQAFAREEDEQRRFQELASVAIRAHQRSALIGSVYGLGSGLLTTIGTAAVMWAAAMRVLDGRLTVGTALVFLAYLASLQWQLSAFTDDVHDAADGRREHRSRHGGVRRRRRRAGAARGAGHCRRPRGDVRLENVTFGYRADRRCCAACRSAAAAGDAVAIVGATGAGKSTLVGLMPRFFDAGGGRVLIDGRDVRDVHAEQPARADCHRAAGAVPVPDDVAENIAFGRPDAARARSRPRRAPPTRTTSSWRCRDGLRHGHWRAGRDAFRRRAPADRDRPGAAQGRADPDPGRADQRARRRRPSTPSCGALERLMRGRTTFIIAHRLSTIRNADRRSSCSSMDEVVEQGTHDELLARAAAATPSCTACSLRRPQGRRRR